MAIGRTFKESLQKALRSLEIGHAGFESPAGVRTGPRGCRALWAQIETPRPGRLWAVAEVLRRGGSVEELYARSRIDPWFLRNIAEIVAQEQRARGASPRRSAKDSLRAAKQAGFSDRRLAALWGLGEEEVRAPAPRARRRPGLQARRHLRRRVRGLHALPLLDLRGRVRGAAHAGAQGHDPRRRAEPDRPGHRVRLLLRARGLRAARGGLRDDHGQLQPGDGLDRLRHQRPALLRAAHPRGRARDRRAGAAARA